MNNIKEYAKIKIFVIPSEDTKILEFSQYQKTDQARFVTDADLDCIIEKTDGCENNPELSCKRKVSERIPSGFSMSIISLFRSIEKDHDVCRGKDCIKKFCVFLIEHAMKTISIQKRNEVINKRAT